MTDWKEQARKHEESANEYARMNYELEAINEVLVNALKAIRVEADTRDRTSYKSLGIIQIMAREALRKAEETP